MAIQLLQNLIDKQDGFELIRQQIVALLVAERDNQIALAEAASRDVSDWQFKVYEERFSPWEAALNADGVVPDPIVNVWFDSDSFEGSSSTRAETQKCTAAYNIDVYGFGVPKDTDEGHDPGEMLATFASHRVTRLVRNILMASQNTYLQLPRGTAWDRQIQSRQSYQPRLDQRAVIETVALRMRYQVSFNEVSPQYEGVPLENLVATVLRHETGEVYAVLDFDYQP